MSSEPGFRIHQTLRGYPRDWQSKKQRPPGLQRQLARNGKLPPVLDKKVQPPPAELMLRLPKLPAGSRYVVLGGNVILFDETTSPIVNILTKVF